MATDFTEETAAEAVTESFGAQTDPRLREVLTALVRHLHGFAREVELTIPEWEKAVDFLTRTGQMCDDDRQEFILLSDVLGLSMLTETISNRKFGVATECGLGRRSPESVPALLGLHRSAADYLATTLGCQPAG